jgi:hypothetical protein
MSNQDYYYYQNTLDPDTLEDGDIIYTQAFHHYKRQLLDTIRDTKKVILISHNCDDALDDSYVLPENVIKWYAVNTDTYNPRIEAIPIGIENDNRDFGKDKKNKMLAKLQESKSFRNLVYMDHRIAVNPVERIRPYQILSDKPWVTAKTDEDNVPYDEYLDNLYNHKFAICPRGNGWETHRPWEALYMGTIPIVRRNLSNRFFIDLPICFIRDWGDLAEDFLNREYDRISQSVWKKEMLTFEYWKNKILNTI